MKRADATDLVLELAADQWGLLSAASARDAGLADVELKRLADVGVIERVYRGLYRVVRFPEDRWESVHVAWMATDLATLVWERLDRDDEVVVSHASAAEILGIGDLPAFEVELSAPRRIRLRLPVKVHVRPVPREDWLILEGVPVTTAARTVADLAAAGIDGSHLAVVVADALDKGLASRDALSTSLSAWAKRYSQSPGDGSGLVEWCVDEAGAQSPVYSSARIVDALGARLTQSPAFQEAVAAQLASTSEVIQRFLFSEAFAARQFEPLREVMQRVGSLDDPATAAKLGEALRTIPFVQLDPSTSRAIQDAVRKLNARTIADAETAGGQARHSE